MWFLRGCVEAIRAFWENIVDLQLDFAKKKICQRVSKENLLFLALSLF